MFKYVWASLAGAVIVFLWSIVSWMVLPWHNATMNTFTDESSIAVAVMSNTVANGVYVMPSPASRKASENITMPMVYMAVVHNAPNMMTPTLFINGFVINLLGAIALVLLLSRAGRLSYFQKVIIVTIAALFAGIVGHLPNWNWWGFPALHTAVAIADLVIGWVLASLAMAKLV